MEDGLTSGDEVVVVAVSVSSIPRTFFRVFTESTKTMVERSMKESFGDYLGHVVDDFLFFYFYDSNTIMYDIMFRR